MGIIFNLSTYRFNISLNDGWRDNPNWRNSNHTIWLNNKIGSSDGHESKDSFIYNNTVIINRTNNPYETAIDIKGENTRIFNNIFWRGKYIFNKFNRNIDNVDNFNFFFYYC